MRDSYGGCLAGAGRDGGDALRQALSARPRPPLQPQKVIMTMRLRTSYGPYSRLPGRNNRHVSCGSEHTGTQDLCSAGKAGSVMAVPTGTTGPAGRTARRADAGVVQLTQRDIDGLLLCGEHYGAPYDLLAVALGVPPGRLRAILRRWRRAGDARSGGWSRAGLVLADPGRDERDGAGVPGWQAGAGAAGAYPRGAGGPVVDAGQPGLGGGPAVVALRAAAAADEPAAGRGGHVADAEIRWPSVAGAPSPGESGRSRSS